MHTDIDREKPIFTRTPARLHPWIKLARLDRPIGIWLLLLPGWWAILLAHGGLAGMTLRGWGFMLLFGIGAVLMRAAGCVVNDLWDKDLDAQVERTKMRPLASGEISRKEAFIFLFALLLPSFLILLCLGKVAIILGFLALPLVGAYPYMKRVTWWPQAFLGLTFNWGALMGFAAVEGRVGIAALLLYAGGFFWTMAYDTIYAHQDIADDIAVGIKSTARLFGEKSKTYVAVFHGLAALLVAGAKVLAAPHAAMILVLAPSFFFAWRTVSRWDPADAASSLKAFSDGWYFGWAVLAAAAF